MAKLNDYNRPLLTLDDKKKRKASSGVEIPNTDSNLFEDIIFTDAEGLVPPQPIYDEHDNFDKPVIEKYLSEVADFANKASPNQIKKYFQDYETTRFGPFVRAALIKWESRSLDAVKQRKWHELYTMDLMEKKDKSGKMPDSPNPKAPIWGSLRTSIWSGGSKSRTKSTRKSKSKSKNKTKKNHSPSTKRKIPKIIMN